MATNLQKAATALEQYLFTGANAKLGVVALKPSSLIVHVFGDAESWKGPKPTTWSTFPVEWLYGAGARMVSSATGRPKVWNQGARKPKAVVPKPPITADIRRGGPPRKAFKR
jgi:hypothetical protein